MSELIEAYWMHFVGGMIGGFVTMQAAKWFCRFVRTTPLFPWNGESSNTSTYDGPIEMQGVIDRRNPPPPVPGDKYAYAVNYYRRRWLLWPKLVAVYHERFRADGTDYCEVVFDRRRCRIESWFTAEDVKMRRPGELKCCFHGTDGCDALRAAQRRAEAKGLAST